MSALSVNLRAALASHDIPAFICCFETALLAGERAPDSLEITQQLLPPVLIAALENGEVSARDVVSLWKLVRDGMLLVVDNDLLSAINRRLVGAWRELRGPDAPLPTPLKLFVDEPTTPVSHPPVSPSPSVEPRGIPMERVVIASSFVIGTFAMSDTLGFRKNLAASSQEREFLRAVRQFFPSLRVYPNVPLRNFIAETATAQILPGRLRSYLRNAQVDVLLCTEDEDPVAGIELDSVLHDEARVQERDRMKDELFTFAGLQLVRIRATDTASVRAEDFYDLLQAKHEQLDLVRPRRLRPRRNHDMLVPAESLTRTVGF